MQWLSMTRGHPEYDSSNNNNNWKHKQPPTTVGKQMRHRSKNGKQVQNSQLWDTTSVHHGTALILLSKAAKVILKRYKVMLASQTNSGRKRTRSKVIRARCAWSSSSVSGRLCLTASFPWNYEVWNAGVCWARIEPHLRCHSPAMLCRLPPHLPAATVMQITLSLSVLTANFPGGPGLAGTRTSPFWIRSAFCWS